MQKFNESEKNDTELAQNINELIALRAAHPVASGLPSGLPGADVAKTAKSLGMKIQLALKKTNELGTMDKQSAEFLQQMSGDPNGWLFNTPESSLAVIRDSNQRAVEDQARNMGFSPRGVAKSGGATGDWSGDTQAPPSPPRGPRTLAEAEATVRPRGQ